MSKTQITSAAKEILSRWRAANSPSAAADLLALLTDLISTSDPWVIPQIAGALVSEGEIGRMAQDGIAQILRQVPPEGLPDFEQTFRRSWSEIPPWQTAWRNLERAQVYWLANRAHRTWLLGLCSFHPNGHIREVAVDGLSRQSDGHEIRFLILRLNDWVPTIRKLAYRALMARLVPAKAAHSLDCSLLFDWLGTCGRSNHVPIIDRFKALFFQPECREALLNGLHSSTRRVRRFFLRMIETVPLPGGSDLLRSALDDSDPVNRLVVARQLLGRVGDSELIVLVRTLTSDPFMPIRRETILAILRRNPVEAVAFLNEGLFDRHNSIRELCQFHLGNDHGQDVSLIYTRELEMDSRRRHIALRGLADTGSNPNPAPFLSALESTDPAQRAAGVNALGKLNALPFKRALPALLDSSAKVSNQALQVLVTRPWESDPTSLATVFESDSPRHVRRNALTLLMAMEKWTCLPLLLRIAATDSLEGIRTRKFLWKWLLNSGRANIQPSKAQHSDAQKAVAELVSKLEPDLRSELINFLADFYQ